MVNNTNNNNNNNNNNNRDMIPPEIRKRLPVDILGRWAGRKRDSSTVEVVRGF